ncbi:MAG: SDR family NAD(P)-dependent oxidoreductase [Candidatus Promineifilaceae bacterium]|nr:SDR family NAD(P)-dependent oxidoreductase [Candidatus Promineifilaceae bacterium]
MKQTETVDGKRALITGGTDGIGKEVARGLARQGGEVIIAGRNKEKGRAAAAELNRDAGRQAVAFVPADLSLMGNVRHLAETVLRRQGRLDLLVHSAGVIHTGFELTEEGLETNFATNYLSRFLLTHLLLERLQASAPARVLIIAAARGKGKLNFEQIERPTRGGMRALGQSQLANDIYTMELAARLEGSAVEVAAIHPGAVDTNIRRQFPGWLNRIMGLLFGRMVMTAAEGAELPLWLATSGESINGRLFKPQRNEIVPAASVLDLEQRRRLWEVSTALVGVEERQPA